MDHTLLLAMIERKIGCARTLDIIRQLIIPGNVGIPIGSLTSQLFANIYGSKLDNFIHHKLKNRRWARYMDDVVILGNDPEKLRDDFIKIKEFSQDNLNLSISKWE